MTEQQDEKLCRLKRLIEALYGTQSSILGTSALKEPEDYWQVLPTLSFDIYARNKDRLENFLQSENITYQEDASVASGSSLPRKTIIIGNNNDNQKDRMASIQHVQRFINTFYACTNKNALKLMQSLRVTFTDVSHGTPSALRKVQFRPDLDRTIDELLPLLKPQSTSAKQLREWQEKDETQEIEDYFFDVCVGALIGLGLKPTSNRAGLVAGVEPVNFLVEQGLGSKAMLMSDYAASALSITLLPLHEQLQSAQQDIEYYYTSVCKSSMEPRA